MRSMFFGLVFGTVLVFAAQGLARGEDEDAETVKPAAVKALRGRVEALEAHIRYLGSREEALTRYVLANEARAAGLRKVVTQARREGFENKAMPAASRITLLRGMEAMASSLGTDLPKLTKPESAMLKAIQRAEAAIKK